MVAVEWARSTEVVVACEVLAREAEEADSAGG